MVEAVQGKSPARVRAGKAGMVARWGPPGTRVIRLDSLPVEVRLAVVTLVEAAKKATPTAENVGMAASEGQANDQPTD